MSARGVRRALGWHLAQGFGGGVLLEEGLARGRMMGYSGDVSLNKNSDCHTEVPRS